MISSWIAIVVQEWLTIQTSSLSSLPKICLKMSQDLGFLFFSNSDIVKKKKKKDQNGWISYGENLSTTEGMKQCMWIFIRTTPLLNALAFQPKFPPTKNSLAGSLYDHFLNQGSVAAGPGSATEKSTYCKRNHFQ